VTAQHPFHSAAKQTTPSQKIQNTSLRFFSATGIVWGQNPHFNIQVNVVFFPAHLYLVQDHIVFFDYFQSGCFLFLILSRDF